MIMETCIKKLKTIRKIIKFTRTSRACKSASAQSMSGSVMSSSGARVSGSGSVVRSNKLKLSAVRGPSEVMSWSTSSSMASVETLKRHGGDQRAGTGEVGDQRCVTLMWAAVSPSTGVAVLLPLLYLV